MFDGIGGGFERIMAMNESIWARHANSWIGW